MAALLTRPASALSVLVTGAVLGSLLRPAIYVSLGFYAGWSACQHYKGDWGHALADSGHAAQGAVAHLSAALSSTASDASGPAAEKNKPWK